MTDAPLHPEVEALIRRLPMDACIMEIIVPEVRAIALLAASKAREEITQNALRAADLLDEWAREIRSACSDVAGKFGCDDCPHVEMCRSDVEELERTAAISRGKP